MIRKCLAAVAGGRFTGRPTTPDLRPYLISSWQTGSGMGEGGGGEGGEAGGGIGSFYGNYHRVGLFFVTLHCDGEDL